MTHSADNHDIAALITGWIHRDVGAWDQLRELFHPEARISVSWFDGLASDFVDASAKMGQSELRSKHVITAPLITFSESGDRAITETNAMVVSENRSLSLGTVTHNRYIDRVERRAGRWGIVRRESIYDFSSFTFPTGSFTPIKQDVVARFPIEYASLAYLLVASGFQVERTYPVKNSEQERSIKKAAADWLSSDEVPI